MNLKLGCGQSLRYDMSGGAWDRVMGVLAYYEEPYLPMSGNSMTSNSGFTGRVWQSDSYAEFTNSPPLAFPEEKYYNLYKVSTTKDGMPTSYSLSDSIKACNGGICYGQALSETTGWYEDYAGFVFREGPWSMRGGPNRSPANAGVFYSYSSFGSASDAYGSRFVLTP